MDLLRGRRTRWTRRAAVVVAATVASACAHGPLARGRSEADVRAAIAAANAEFSRALVAGDARAMAEVFTEDGALVPATRRGIVSGRAEIEAYNAGRLEARRYLDAAVTTLQLGVQGDLAWEIGTSQVTLQQPSGAPVTLTGRYLAVWQRGPDGRWRIRAEVPVADPVP